ncbi:MAG: CD225/dispanin family protein [Mangrovibacterium sp.]
MSTHYFYTKGGENFGPFSVEQLREEGIAPDTRVWYAGLSDWTPANELEELKVLFQQEASGANSANFSTPPPPPPFESRNANQQASTGGYTPSYPPKSYLVGAILVTIFCCMPFGIVGLVNSLHVESRFYAGDYEGSFRASMQARRWINISIIAAILSAGLSILVNILFFAGSLFSFDVVQSFV